MRVYFDTTFDALVLDAAPDLFLPRSLECVTNGDRVEIWLKGPDVRKAGPIDYTAIQDQSGGGFASAAAVKTYLDDEFAKYRTHLGLVIIDTSIVASPSIALLAFS